MMGILDWLFKPQPTKAEQQSLLSDNSPVVTNKHETPEQRLQRKRAQKEYLITAIAVMQEYLDMAPKEENRDHAFEENAKKQIARNLINIERLTKDIRQIEKQLISPLDTSVNLADVNVALNSAVSPKLKLN